MEDEFGTLIVTRTAEDDIGMRDLYVRIDDYPEQTLLYGETLQTPLPLGSHRLKITNRLYSDTTEFEITAGATLSYDVANVPTRGIFAFLMVIGGTPAYRVRLQHKLVS